jgi:hypothetical protein
MLENVELVYQAADAFNLRILSAFLALFDRNVEVMSRPRSGRRATGVPLFGQSVRSLSSVMSAVIVSPQLTPPAFGRSWHS